MSKHTPLPWNRMGACIYIGSPGSCDAVTGEPKWGGFDLRNCPDTEANAQLIVTAVNNHAKLVEALRTVVDALNEHDPDGLVIDNTVTEGAVILLAQLDGELE